MKKWQYIKPLLEVYPIHYESPLLSQSPGNKDTDDNEWDGPWDAKETDLDDSSLWEDNMWED